MPHHTEADQARLDRETRDALAQVKAGGAGLDVPLADTLEAIEAAPTAWRLICTRRFETALADASPPQAAVAVAACAVLTVDPATALGAFTTRHDRGGWQLALAGWGHLHYQLDEPARTVELHALAWAEHPAGSPATD
jgi:hypothetical protein